MRLPPLKGMMPNRIRSTASRLLVIAAILTSTPGLRASAQAATATPVANPRPTPFGIDVGTFYHDLDNGYSDWRGADVRLSYSSPRFSPFASASTQHRDEGYQNSYGLGSYVTLNRYFYSIVGFSVATGGTAVLFPRLRWDASLMADSRVVPGLVIATGYTHLSFGGGSTGSMVSLGPIWYHGPLILSGSMRLNHDGVGGANTGSGEFGGQYGAEGKSWVGANVAVGHEAYQILSATPLDAQFTNVGGAVFYQRWLTARTAITTRFEYQDKLTAYHRRGVSLSYHVAF
jgi:YaiO family outer membrane protein